MENKERLRNEFRLRIHAYIIRLIKFLNVLPKNFIVQAIIRQLIRSGASIGANYFEAYGASSKKDFQNYFNHLLKSANESKFWIEILRDSSFMPVELISDCNWLLGETKELANIFASSILTLKGKR